MVYGGKPSRGCRTCRARRIKCDEGKPTCKRCQKSRRECGGYRPEFELVHRDQTEPTVRRFGKAAGSQQRQSADRRDLIFVHETPPAWHGQRRPSLSPEPALTVSLAHRASCHFASNFILVPVGDAPQHGFMEYLVPLMGAAPPGTALRHAFNACAFALLGNCARADGVNLAQLSLKEHTLALAQTHKALGDPAEASTDSTLAAVLLLCLYESITAIRESRMLAWRSHIDGAVRIVETRGRDQLRSSRLGSRLFGAVRHHLVSRILSSGESLPFGIDWWMSDDDTESLLSCSQRFALRFSELRAEANLLLSGTPRSPESLSNAQDLAGRVQSLDLEVATWLGSIPEDLRPRTVAWVPEADVGLSSHGEAEVYPGPVDVYPDYVTAMAWNIGRVSRLLLASLHLRLTAWICYPADYRTTTEYETSGQLCQGVISEIVASVPYHLNCPVGNMTPSEPGLSAFACGEDGSHKALPAMFLIWSLICVKNHDMSTDEQRTWAKGRLQYIADRVGLKYAHIVSQANIRFPSMMIRKDGSMVPVDPLRAQHKSLQLGGAGPQTHEAAVSASQSPPSD